MAERIEGSAELQTWVDRNPASREIIMFARKLDIESTIDSGVLDPTVLEIMHNILTATDEDAIFAAANAGTVSGKNFTGIPFLLKSDGVQWKRSGNQFTSEGGFPWYALLRVTNLQTGEQQVVNCGGLSFVTTLWRLIETGSIESWDDKGGMPLQLIGKPTSAGYTILLLSKYVMPKVMQDAGSKSKS